MGLKVFTNTKVRKPQYCSTGIYVPAAARLESAPLSSGGSMSAMRTGGKGTGSCYCI